MKKLILLIILTALSGTFLAINAQTKQPEKAKVTPAEEKAPEKKPEAKDFFTVTTPKGWKASKNYTGAGLKIYGTDFNKENAKKGTTTKAIIYMDFYSKDNTSAPTLNLFIERNTKSKMTAIGSSRTEPEPVTVAGRKATQFFQSGIIFVPPMSPDGVKVKIIERLVVVNTKNKEGFYLFRVYADEDSYVETNEVFDQMLKTVKLLK